jgi:hypothetical protein
MERIAMSQEERDWLDWLKRARDGQVTERLAAEKMGISDRWAHARYFPPEGRGSPFFAVVCSVIPDFPRDLGFAGRDLLAAAIHSCSLLPPLPGEAASRSSVEGFALHFQQGLLMSGIQYLLVTVSTVRGPHAVPVPEV